MNQLELNSTVQEICRYFAEVPGVNFEYLHSDYFDNYYVVRVFTIRKDAFFKIYIPSGGVVTYRFKSYSYAPFRPSFRKQITDYIKKNLE